MGQIDITDILTDPDFVDSCLLIHRTPNVDLYGQNQLCERSELTVGSVQPVSGKTLSRLPDSLRVADIRSFWIKGKIISDGTCQYPDLISFQGSRYAVQTILDWTSWGAGWCEGVCIREKVTL